MKLNLCKMGKLLKNEGNSEEQARLSARVKMHKYQDIFFDIMDWTDLSKVEQYSIEEYEELLERLPSYVEQMEKNEIGYYNLGQMLNRLETVASGSKRLL